MQELYAYPQVSGSLPLLADQFTTGKIFIIMIVVVTMLVVMLVVVVSVDVVVVFTEDAGNNFCRHTVA